MDLSYQEAYIMNREEARRKLVESYIANGSISHNLDLLRGLKLIFYSCESRVAF